MLKLPVFINKFIEETVMGSADFFSRWKQLAKYEPFRKHTPSLSISAALSLSHTHYALKITYTQYYCNCANFHYCFFPGSQEAQKIFAAKHSMEKEFAASKVSY